MHVCMYMCSSVECGLSVAAAALSGYERAQLAGCNVINVSCGRPYVSQYFDYLFVLMTPALIHKHISIRDVSYSLVYYQSATQPTSLTHSLLCPLINSLYLCGV